MSQEIHKQITAEEIGHEFEGHATTENVSDY
ncbi:TRAP transporter small permease, partial [Rhizobium leguminosarum]